MHRGDIVVNEENEFFVFLSAYDGQANCAVVESIFDPYQGDDVSKVTSLKKLPLDTLTVADNYPTYFNQLSFT